MAILTKQYTHGPESVSENATWSATLPSDFSRIISCDAQYTISGNRITFTTKGSLTSYSAYVYENVWVSDLAPGVPGVTEDPKDGPGHYERKRVRRTKYGYKHVVNIKYSTNRVPTKPSTIACTTQLKAGETAVITWAASADPEGQPVTYTLYAQYGGSENRMLLYTGPKNTFSYTVPSGVESVNFIVVASDGEDTSDASETGNLPVITNSAPVISGEDKTLETKGQPVVFEYTVVDNDGDSIEVTETLNGVQIKKLSNAPQNQAIVAKVTLEQLREIPTGQKNLLLIQAKDTKGQSAFRRITFVKTNTPPTLTIGGISDDDILSAPKKVTIEAKDEEGDPITVSIYLDKELVFTKDLSGEESKITYSIPTEKWVSIDPNSAHSVRIIAADTNGAQTSKIIPFTRQVDKIEFKAVYQSDSLKSVVNRLYVTVQWMLADGVVPKILMCNNALDQSPAWEDVTKQILENTDVIFKNTQKTNVNWAIGVHVKIDKGTSTSMSWIGAIGGAIKEA